MKSHCIMIYWKRLYIFEIIQQNHLKWCMCVDVSHDCKHANPQDISYDDDDDDDGDDDDDDDEDDDDDDFSISHAEWCHSYDHLHIKQILISEERSKIWKSCK